MMSDDRQNTVAYLATLFAIVALTSEASAICIFMNSETHLPQIVAALAFIGSAIVGLIGVIGTFSRKGATSANFGTADSVTVNSNKDPAP